MTRIIIPLLLLTCFTAITAAQEADPSSADTETAGAISESEQYVDAVHDELRKLKADVENAVSNAQWETLAGLLSDKVIVTWMDGTQSHGPDEVLEYMKSKTEGESPIVEEFSVKVDVTDLSDFHGDDAATAFGQVNCDFVLRGRPLSIGGPWTAFVVREDGAWKLAQVHASVGVFDNPMLQWAWRCVWIAGGVGLLLGVVLGRLVGRRRKAATETA